MVRGRVPGSGPCGPGPGGELLGWGVALLVGRDAPRLASHRDRPDSSDTVGPISAFAVRRLAREGQVDKNDAVVELTLPEDANIYASKQTAVLGGRAAFVVAARPRAKGRRA